MCIFSSTPDRNEIPTATLYVVKVGLSMTIGIVAARRASLGGPCGYIHLGHIKKHKLNWIELNEAFVNTVR